MIITFILRGYLLTIKRKRKIFGVIFRIYFTDLSCSFKYFFIWKWHARIFSVSFLVSNITIQHDRDSINLCCLLDRSMIQSTSLICISYVDIFILRYYLPSEISVLESFSSRISSISIVLSFTIARPSCILSTI